MHAVVSALADAKSPLGLAVFRRDPTLRLGA